MARCEKCKRSHAEDLRGNICRERGKPIFGKRTWRQVLGRISGLGEWGRVCGGVIMSSRGREVVRPPDIFVVKGEGRMDKESRRSRRNSTSKRPGKPGGLKSRRRRH